MRTRVSRRFSFDAAHQLPWHPGRCRQLHGHTYRLSVSVEGSVDEHGIVCDFADLDALVHREVIEHYDHRFLNDLLDNPTAELLAAEIWKRLDAATATPALRHVALCHLALWETADSWVELWP